VLRLAAFSTRASTNKNWSPSPLPDFRYGSYRAANETHQGSRQGATTRGAGSNRACARLGSVSAAQCLLCLESDRISGGGEMTLSAMKRHPGSPHGSTDLRDFLARYAAAQIVTDSTFTTVDQDRPIRWNARGLLQDGPRAGTPLPLSKRCAGRLEQTRRRWSPRPHVGGKAE
jgi:hypothetical protein